MKFYKNIAILLCVVLLSACSHKIQVENVTIVADENNIVQSPIFFADSLQYAQNSLLTDKAQEEAYTKFKKRFTAAWKQKKPYKDNLAYFRSYVEKNPEKRGYAENLHRWSDKHYQALRQNSQYERFPSMAQNALIVKDTNLRLAPTDKPSFTNPNRPGQAYPFDMFQNSLIHAGSAVKVFHVSADNAWYYVEAASASGWVCKEHLAFTDVITESLWKDSPDYVAVIHDNSMARNENVQETFTLGTVFPLLSESSNGFMIAVPLRNAYGNVQIEHCFIAREYAVKMPLAFTARSVAKLSEQLIGNLYGWGGLYNDRDCSSTLQDLFTPYGIWLPRNSAQQANAGMKIDLTNLSDWKKEEIIRQQAIPFQTLIYLPGHIGLYMGQYEGKAVMLHNMWGVRIDEYGRFVVGKTLISTLYVGKELKGFNKSLMSRVKTLTVVGKK